MRQTRQMAQPVPVASCPALADVPTERPYALPHAIDDRSDTRWRIGGSGRAKPIKRRQELLAGIQAGPPRVTRRMTLDELTASIVHEVIQPLAAIVVNGETCMRWLGRDEPQLDKARGSVAAMIRSAQRSSDIIRRLRALSTQRDVQRMELNLNEIIEEAVSLIEHEVVRNEVSLRLNLAAKLPRVRGDRVQLQQVIINILSNGIQAMASVCDRPRELLIRSQHLDFDQVVVMVQDNGTGIGAGDFDHLFDTFFTTKVGGTGIGLFICRSVIEAHGGLIWASSNCGHGAAFYFVLPAIRARDTR